MVSVESEGPGGRVPVILGCGVEDRFEDGAQLIVKRQEPMLKKHCANYRSARAFGGRAPGYR